MTMVWPMPKLSSDAEVTASGFRHLEVVRTVAAVVGALCSLATLVVVVLS
jgi:hypothetical protein